MIRSIYQFVRVRVVQHILFWIAIVLYFTLGYGAPGRYGETIARVLVFLPGHIFLTYTFFYILIPFFLYQRRYFLLALTGILTYAISLLYAYYINFQVLEKLNLQSIWVGSPLIGQTTMLGAALAIKFLKQWYQEKKNAMEAEQQKSQAELKLLKSQIHPHFLFNTLNNLYGYSIENSPRAPEIVLKLSALLRFMIYESNAPYISLGKEISLLQQYIELEQLRYGDRLEVSINISGDIQNKVIAPLLLIPLVENAFKHGTSEQLDKCWISLNLNVRENEMYFKLINSKDNLSTISMGNYRGIGLQNVKKRLELLYPKKHDFYVKEKEDTFLVNLRIVLQDYRNNENSNGDSDSIINHSSNVINPLFDSR